MGVIYILLKFIYHLHEMRFHARIVLFRRVRVSRTCFVERSEFQCCQITLFIFLHLPLAVWLFLVLTDLGVLNWSRTRWRQVEVCDLGLSRPPLSQEPLSLVRAGLQFPWLVQVSGIPVSQVKADLLGTRFTLGSGAGILICHSFSWRCRLERKLGSRSVG